MAGSLGSLVAYRRLATPPATTPLARFLFSGAFYRVFTGFLMRTRGMLVSAALAPCRWLRCQLWWWFLLFLLLFVVVVVVVSLRSCVCVLFLGGKEKFAFELEIVTSPAASITRRPLPWQPSLAAVGFATAAERVITALLPPFTEFLPACTELYRVLPSFIGFYWVLLGFTGFY